MKVYRCIFVDKIVVALLLAALDCADIHNNVNTALSDDDADGVEYVYCYNDDDDDDYYNFDHDSCCGSGHSVVLLAPVVHMLAVVFV